MLTILGHRQNGLSVCFALTATWISTQFFYDLTFILEKNVAALLLLASLVAITPCLVAKAKSDGTSKKSDRTSNRGPENAELKFKLPPPPVIIPLTAEQQKLYDNGKMIYAGLCAACHQPTGTGLEGLAPPLLDSSWVLGPADVPIRIVIHGLGGPINVAGRTWALEMPPLPQFSDEQIASVLTYIRRDVGTQRLTGRDRRSHEDSRNQQSPHPFMDSRRVEASAHSRTQETLKVELHCFGV